MAISPKIIKKRLRSLQNTKKITKAMEMVSAAKMRKAVNATLASRIYAETAWETIQNLANQINPTSHPLLEKRSEIKKICFIVLSSNRGLCGGFNNQIVNCAQNFAHEKFSNQNIDWIVIGKKAGLALARAKKNIIAQFDKEDTAINIQAVSALSKMIINDYVVGKYDLYYLFYTDYISAFKQKPRAKQILPLIPLPDSNLGAIDQKIIPEGTGSECLFEPNVDQILEKFLPHLILFQLYQTLLESNASEHSARMLTMRNASDATEDIISDLTLSYNEARQAQITREIAEIASGKTASE